MLLTVIQGKAERQSKKRGRWGQKTVGNRQCNATDEIGQGKQDESKQWMLRMDEYWVGKVERRGKEGAEKRRRVEVDE